MKALALFGLLFFSNLSYTFAQPELSSGTYGNCTIYHRLQKSIKKASWLGDCGPGLAEGYGEFVFYFADLARRSNYMHYKNGKPVTSYSFSSDPFNGNRLLKTNADQSITVLKDCGKAPEHECAAIVNFAYDRSDKPFWANQQVKGSYAGPQYYPGVVFDRTTSGGFTPAPAEFLRGSLGVRVACTEAEVIKAAENAVKANVYNPNETRPCYKEREFSKYNYYYLTTLDLSCPSGTNKKIDRWKDLVHGDLNGWVVLAIKACSQSK